MDEWGEVRVMGREDEWMLNKALRYAHQLNRIMYIHQI